MPLTLRLPRPLVPLHPLQSHKVPTKQLDAGKLQPQCPSPSALLPQTSKLPTYLKTPHGVYSTPSSSPAACQVSCKRANARRPVIVTTLRTPTPPPRASKLIAARVASWSRVSASFAGDETWRRRRAWCRAGIGSRRRWCMTNRALCLLRIQGLLFFFFFLAHVGDRVSNSCCTRMQFWE
ncbi:hypothetical protein FN846DRAFT_645995 [Sphaerosporella brunnea]|uniref:Uncharacterized protein n=1 Tax=Sphaerosporella brunnea TaxID=1250544 RepID=A0A5J5F0W8_9PEZI|nr:hypothetical protein FN846DRAFT_645995 [Sphaerosporella brunnea]